mmetsp:Transcript_10242/g.17185  ORF Transcript_10242/g.17185 Transcript_10242/m.17185 type:complete len:134 (+) Transcript_10242:208-609(+)
MGNWRVNQNFDHGRTDRTTWVDGKRGKDTVGAYFGRRRTKRSCMGCGKMTNWWSEELTRKRAPILNGLLSMLLANNKDELGEQYGRKIINEYCPVPLRFAASMCVHQTYHKSDTFNHNRKANECTRKTRTTNV